MASISQILSYDTKFVFLVNRPQSLHQALSQADKKGSASWSHGFCRIGPKCHLNALRQIKMNTNLIFFRQSGRLLLTFTLCHAALQYLFQLLINLFCYYCYISNQWTARVGSIVIGLFTYMKYNFCVAPCHTTSSHQIRITPNCVGCCWMTWCNTKIRLHVNTYVHT
jgi:hypothetical protein